METIEFWALIYTPAPRTASFSKKLHSIISVFIPVMCIAPPPLRELSPFAMFFVKLEYFISTSEDVDLIAPPSIVAELFKNLELVITPLGELIIIAPPLDALFPSNSQLIIWPKSTVLTELNTETAPPELFAVLLINLQPETK